MPDAKRPPAVGVSRCDESIVGEDADRERTLHLVQGIQYPMNLILLTAASDEMKNDLRIGRRLKNSPFILKARTNLPKIRKVTVMAEGDVTVTIIHNERLNIEFVRR